MKQLIKSEEYFVDLNDKNVVRHVLGEGFSTYLYKSSSVLRAQQRQ